MGLAAGGDLQRSDDSGFCCRSSRLLVVVPAASIVDAGLACHFALSCFDCRLGYVDPQSVDEIPRLIVLTEVEETVCS